MSNSTLLEQLKAIEDRRRAKLLKAQKDLQAAQAKARAEERKQQAKRWQALGKIVEECLGADVTPEAVRQLLLLEEPPIRG